MAEYFGVRHFSPICSHLVVKFLDRVKPDIVLIEGPSDLSGLIEPLMRDDVRFPAAILAYTETAPVKTVLYPLALHSPELNAMKWARQHGNIPVEFCDLPGEAALYHALEEQSEKEDSAEENEAKKPSVYDMLEKATGQDDDVFWEYNFEQVRDLDDYLAAAKEYGSSLREFSPKDKHNELREAYMRRRINEAEQKYGRVAVITGAFHTAGLENVPYSEADEKLTYRLKTVPTKATLMPYSNYRLSARSGYGAGAKAPGYHEIMYKNLCRGESENTPAEYLSRIAAFQRKNGFAASSAEVIEAVRLADTLAAIRGGRSPCLADLRDAAVTCMGHGSFGEVSLACADVEIGTRIGELPEGSVCTSVQDDFMRQLKDLKLDRFRTPTAQTLELDLRENIRVKSEKSAFLDLNRSYFLHRLLAAGVHFGEKQRRQQDNATWAEKWELRWVPETEIQIVEASLIGSTVVQAARNTLGLKLTESQSLKEISQLVTSSFECGLQDCVKSASARLTELAAECSSVPDEGEALAELSGIVRYGNIRRIDPEPLVPIISQLFLRICLQMPTEAKCAPDAALLLTSTLAIVNDACTAHDFLESERFIDLLTGLSDSDDINMLVSGYACALLAERGKIAAEKLSELISRRLSRGTPPAEAAAWFEGFSKRNHRALISRLSVWEKLCSFIEELDGEEFKSVLIALRRTFGDFSAGEKADIAENITELLGLSGTNADEFITAAVTEEEQSAIDELDDFDFGDI